MTRGRPLYIERTGWIGFGRADLQLDLFESTWRLGFWRVSVCRVCFITTIHRSRNAVSEAIRQIEDRMRDKDGQ